MTRVTSEPEELQGAEFSRVHLNVDLYAGDLVATLQRLRRARSAWRVAVKLGEWFAEHPTP